MGIRGRGGIRGGEGWGLFSGVEVGGLGVSDGVGGRSRVQVLQRRPLLAQQLVAFNNFSERLLDENASSRSSLRLQEERAAGGRGSLALEWALALRGRDPLTAFLRSPPLGLGSCACTSS